MCRFIYRIFSTENSRPLDQRTESPLKFRTCCKMVPEAGIELAWALWARGILSSIPTPRLLNAIYTNLKNITMIGSRRTDAESR